MSDADALFAQPPEKPETRTRGETARIILVSEWERFALWASLCCSVGLVIIPIVLFFAGAYTGHTFFTGLLLTAVVIGGLAFAPHAFAWPVDVLDARLKQRTALRAYARDVAEWQAGAPARAAARRRHHGLILFNGLLKEANAKRTQAALAVQQVAARRVALEAQLGELFRQYRLRNDWDASDAALVPRLQAAFRKWVQEKPPFAPEDMALLATSADQATRVLLPPGLTAPA